MFETINNLHDQSNGLIGFLLYQTALNDAKFSKRISDRQFNTNNYVCKRKDYKAFNPS